MNVWQAAAKFKGLEWEHGGKALAAGDLNGDSITDLIMGGDTDSTLAYQAGSVLIVPGPLQGVLEHSDAIKMISTQAGDYLGTSVAAGDLDCDGTSELLVGAPHSNDAGGALFLLDEGLEGLF
ncbi:MAG: hypothetical protein GY807_17835 [Gammaproteobacteria bacterium]|nr:hypothetical protein [Gammaproteobacteria bacterium]